MEISGFYPFKQVIGEMACFEGEIQNNQNSFGNNKKIGHEEIKVQSMTPKKEEAMLLKDKPRWTAEEDQLLLELYSNYGAKWHQISLYFNHRPSSSVKNHFYRLRSMMTADQRTEIKEALRTNKAKSSEIIHNQVNSLCPEDAIKNNLEVSLTDSITINDTLIQNLGGSLNICTKINEIGDKRSKLKMLRHWESILSNLVEIKKTEIGLDNKTS
ncbi:unnamed protein product [Blepharisma stoltei]|uniref:Myb-like DNA-binding domain containing protein n=1 Tax=Blepharisma stoltei TaxID=1481888 RepID=A0AAU9J3L9_9CILI|nr:unnamed protein product [Blepharisma stoltei]